MGVLVTPDKKCLATLRLLGQSVRLRLSGGGFLNITFEHLRNDKDGEVLAGLVFELEGTEDNQIEFVGMDNNKVVGCDKSR